MRKNPISLGCLVAVNLLILLALLGYQLLKLVPLPQPATEPPLPSVQERQETA